MAEKDESSVSKDYKLDIPFQNSSFYVKGMDNVDWGMKDRLSKIFNRKSGKTLMLAFDHGYIMGSTSGLKRLDVVVPPLADLVDVLMATRGAIRSCVPPIYNKAIALRCTAGSTVLKDDMSNGVIGVDIEDAIRINASCLAVQTFIGSENEKSSLNNLVRVIDNGNKYGIPTLGVVAVGKQMERNTKFFLLATRVIAELGAQIIKTYYCEDFEKVVAACPVPIVIAGGKKLPKKEVLELVYNAVSQGAAGVDMGRNIFQAKNPIAITNAISMIVHAKVTAKEAFQYYEQNIKE